jgi:hypothetical protein
MMMEPRDDGEGRNKTGYQFKGHVKKIKRATGKRHV